MKLAKTVLVKVKRFQGRLKKGAFGETLSKDPVSGPNPHRNRPVLRSHKTGYHTAIYGQSKRRRFDAAWI